MSGWYRCWAIDCSECDRTTVCPTEAQSSVPGVRLVYSKRQIAAMAKKHGWTALGDGRWRCPEHAAAPNETS